jgi:secreted protein with Ig-like and vWFA domain
MNNDDTFNQNKNTNPPTPTAEWEARVVAWVLGEASAFEIAELERLCAEHPEWAVFKRRMEAVHGLAGEAAKPPRETLRLSPERRAKLLAVIGGGQQVAEVSAAEKPLVHAKSTKRSGGVGQSSKRFAWREWALPMAACLALVFSLAAVMIPTVGHVSFSAQRPKRPEPSMTMLGPEPAGEMDAPLSPAPQPLKQLEDRMQVSRRGGGTADQQQENVAGLSGSGFAVQDKDASSVVAFQSVPSAPAPGRLLGGSAIRITAGTPQEFSAERREPTESERLDEARRQTPGFDPFSPQVALTNNKSTDRLKAAAAEVRRRRQIKESASLASADHFAPPAVVKPDSEVDRDVSKLTAKARSQYLAGDLEGAQETFRNAESAQPNNPEAKSFLDRIAKEKAAMSELNRAKSRAQMMEEVGNSWQRPSGYLAKDAGKKTNAALAQRLDQIVIPSVNFNGVELSRVLSTLSAVSEEYDGGTDENRGSPPIVLLDPENRNPPVNITLRNLSLKRILDLITDSTGYSYEITDDAIVVRPQVEAVELEHEFFPLERSIIERMLPKNVPPGGESAALRKFMQIAGVQFDKIEGSDLVYDGAAVIVSQTARNMERVRNILNRYEPVREQLKAPDLDAQLRAETPASTEAISTFSLHVSDASFRLAKASLSRGQQVEATAIRPEEFYNAFDYGEPAPVAGEAVSCRVEQSAHPFMQQRNLLRVAMRVPAAGRGASQPLRLTVLLDTSGSMEREDRAATAQAALVSLASLLGPNDRVSLVGFARTPRLLAESIPGDQAIKVVDLAASTPAEGGTNMEEALKLAGELAMRQRLDGAQNRIVLLTDGAANLGNADPQVLSKQVEALRQNGIAFDACGVVADGLDDTVLEALTRKGDGRYTLINSPDDADATFARQLAGAFRPAAKDVKVQVRFNPSRVGRYRLIGFEQHRLKTEDFRNDAVDAAELASEEAAVALYQVEVLPEGEGELGEVFVRFLDTSSNERVERSWTLAYAPQPPAFARATSSMQLTGSAAFLAEKLRGGDLAGQIRLEEFAPVVEGLAGHYSQATRVQDFITMFRQARRLTGE